MAIHCGRLLRRSNAITLGLAFAQSFATNSAGIGTGEIALFRAMQRSLVSIALPPKLVVEEYHGANHQVTFTGSGTYSRTNARCELSDLLVIVYDRRTKDARLTYIQAKSERSVGSSGRGIAGSALVANLEQWDLLARRPPIRGVGGFQPPADLLASALLPSIGAFAFFLHGPAGVAVYYCAASLLEMPYAYSTRTGKLTARHDVCRCAPAPECLSAYGNAEFGAFLFGLMIGTPILTSGSRQQKPVATWLAAQLRGLAAGAKDGAELAGELARLLDPDGANSAQTPNVGATTLLLFGLADGERPD